MGRPQAAGARSIARGRPLRHSGGRNRLEGVEARRGILVARVSVQEARAWTGSGGVAGTFVPELAEGWARIDGALAGLGPVLGASPLATSVVRGVMTNVMLLVSQPSVRLQMFDQVDVAGRWLQKECGPRGVRLPEASDVDAAVRSIKAQMALMP